MIDQLRSELTKLRKENTEMAGKLDASSLESLTRLEKELSDQRCMVASLQQKLFDTKESLTLALATIVQLNSRITALESEKRDMQREAAEAQVMDWERQATELQQRKQSEVIGRKRQRDALALVHSGHAAVTFELSYELGQASSKLASTTTELHDLTATKSELDQVYAQTVGQLQLAREAHVELTQRHSAEMTQTSAAHTGALDREAARFRELEADLEDERHKRRKVEREKKFFESEAKNNKNQLLIAGGGGAGGAGGAEVESALRELKTMQMALDAANAEIAALRAASQVGAETGAGGVTSSSTATSGAKSSLASSRVAQRVKNGVVSGDATTAAALALPGGGASGAATGISGATAAPASSAAAAPVAAYSSYFEQAGLVDKRLEQADRERRQLIAQNLEESKDKMELQQKLIKAEKEVAALKREKTKLTLEKERLASQLSKLGQEPGAEAGDENVSANLSPPPAARTTRSRVR